MQSFSPSVKPVSQEVTPFWAVMIPTYNPKKDYLEQALRSVLAQDPGPDQMQIEVVDDCSPKVEVAALVQEIARDRVTVLQTPKNLGLAGCWNTCIERSRGKWVHILHQDDYVLPGFYQKLSQAAERHQEVSLLATRSFFVDKEDAIFKVSPRLHNLENGGRVVDKFFYMTPIQCPGVVVKRSFYETHGGFRSDLIFTLDREMWARVIGLAGGLVTSDILSCYRTSDINESARLSRTAEGLYDLNQLSKIFTERYPNFSPREAREQICGMAFSQALRFSLVGDHVAAKANKAYWNQNATAKLWFRRLSQKVERTLFK